MAQNRLGWHRIVLRAGVSLLVSGGFLWLLMARLSHIDVSELGRELTGVSALHWLLALGLTGVSFWAVGHYDAVLHRHFQTGLPEAATRRAGICAIAVSQTIGLGVITGAILRWRMLPGQTLWAATRLTAAVALSFLAGWAVVTASVLLAVPEAPFKPEAVAVIGLACLLTAVSLWAPRWRWRWPNLFTIARLLLLATIDTGAAAAAFYVLCPDVLNLGVAQMLPAFLLALGAGLASGTPGGVGPFEMTLLALLPDRPEAPLLAAVLAWRAVYYALPALIGAAVSIIGPGSVAQPPAPVAPAIGLAPRAELHLLAQGEHRLQGCGAGAGWLCGQTPHVLVGLFDPISPGRRADIAAAVTSLHGLARAGSRVAALYKCGARSAAMARSQGHKVLRIACEAWIDPRSYRLGASSRAGLRRKLRRAEAAGVRITGPADAAPVPLLALDRIAADWAARHGGERGFSMGRYTRAYVQGQRLYIAWKGGAPVAFVTFHAAAQEWTLDLMRHGPDLPDGTMQALIQTAIDDAKRLDLPRLSLAAVPEAGGGLRLPRLLRALFDPCAGLARFKSAFAPRWQPLYLTAPNRAALMLAAAEIARAIHRPAPLPAVEHHHAEYEFASAAPPWHRRGNDV